MLQHTAQQSPVFQSAISHSHSLRTIFQYMAVNIRLLIIIFKESAGNVCLFLAGSVTSNRYVIY
jgi:hypothetical protein